MKMVQKTTTIVEYPNVPSILALVGGALIVLVDVFLLAIQAVSRQDLSVQSQYSASSAALSS